MTTLDNNTIILYTGETIPVTPFLTKERLEFVYAAPMSLDDFNKLTEYQAEHFNEPGYVIYKPEGQSRKGLKITWSDDDTFNKHYTTVVTVDFGDALRALKQGKRVTRLGWNGKGMFLFLLPANDNIPISVITDPNLRRVIETELGTDTFNAEASIRMFTANKKILTGWLASQTDMMSEDWVVLN